MVSPGPAFLVLSQLAIGRSRAAAFGAALGISLGAILYAALTLWGFTLVVSQIAWLGTALRIAGAVYLVYLGLSLFHAASEGEAARPQAPSAEGDARAGFRIGLITALTNPKAIAFFVSLFAVALPPDLTASSKLVLLGAGFAIELGWYVLVACVLSTGWPRRIYARARRTIDRVLGAVLLLAGVRIGIADR